MPSSFAAPTQAFATPRPYTGLDLMIESPIATKLWGRSWVLWYSTSVQLSERDSLRCWKEVPGNAPTDVISLVFAVLPSAIGRKRIYELAVPLRGRLATRCDWEGTMEVLDLFRRARRILFFDPPSSEANDNSISIELATERGSRTISRM